MTTGSPGIPRKLPSVVTTTEEWMRAGLCRSITADFFPTNGHFLSSRPAKEVCNHCPVQIACLDYALEHHIDHGIWGGTSERERRRIRKAKKSA